MHYDLNLLLNYSNMTTNDMQSLSSIVFDNVIKYDFSDNFEYLKVATEYFSVYYLPQIYNNDTGEKYYSENQVINFLQVFCLFEDYNKKHHLGYQDKIDIVFTKGYDKLTDDGFSFHIDKCLYSKESVDNILKKILESRVYSNVYSLFFNNVLKQENAQLEKELKSSNLEDYQRIFTKYYIKDYLKDLSLGRKDSIALATHYLNFFIDYPLEFEKFKNQNNLPPEVACSYHLVNPGLILKKLNKNHLMILESRSSNKSFKNFISGLMDYSAYNINSLETHKHIVREMVKEPAWQNFLSNPRLDRGSFSEHLQSIDKQYRVNIFSNILLDEIKGVWEEKLSSKPKSPQIKI